MCRDRFGHLAGKGFGNDGISCILHCLISSSSPASLCIAACLPLITSMHGPNSYGFDHMTAQSHDGELGGNERHIQLFPAISITRIIIGSVRQHDFSIAHSPCDLKLFSSSLSSPIMSASIEKSDAPTAFSPYLDTVASLFHPMAGPVTNTYVRFHGWKESMGLVQPGTVENLTKEVSRMSRFCH
jgi:hypothetical protein